MKIKANIRYLKESDLYENIINYPNLFIKEGEYIKFIISKIVRNLERIVKKKKHIDINEIFSLKDKQFLSFIYKINTSEIAWGITF